jgi:hypothetical protein
MGSVSKTGRSELLQLALANARRVAGRLRQQERDLARKMPGEVQGGEALRNAALAAEQVANLLERSSAGPAEPPLHP